MAAPKAGTLISVDRGDNGIIGATFDLPTDERLYQRVVDMPNTRLMLLLGREYPAWCTWGRVSVADKVAALTRGIMPTTYVGGAVIGQEAPASPAPASPGPGPAPASPAPASPAPASPAPADTQSLSPLESAVVEIARQEAQAIASAAVATVDETALRSMVDERISGLEEQLTAMLGEMSRPVLNMIHVAGREVREIPGRMHHAFDRVIQEINIGHIVFLPGPAGTGKTTLAKQVAQALDLPVYLMSIGPMTDEFAFWGFKDANGQYHPTPFHQWWTEGGILVLDECDAGAPGSLVCTNTALDSQTGDILLFPNGPAPRHPDAKAVIATANTFGEGANARYVGRNRLDEAFKTRFTYVFVGIDETLERDLVMAACPEHGARWLTIVRAARKYCDAHQEDQITSPRQAIRGAESLEAGASLDTVTREVLLPGADAEAIARIIGV